MPLGSSCNTRAADKLVQAKKVQGGKPSLGRRRSSQIQRDLGGPAMEDVPEGDVSYTPNKVQTRRLISAAAREVLAASRSRRSRGANY